MKKVTTIFKTMLMVAVVFVMAQGCVPTPGGGPTINGTLQLDHPTEVYFVPWSQWPVFRGIEGTYNIMIYKKSDNSVVTSRIVTYGLSNQTNNYARQFFELAPDIYYIKIQKTGGPVLGPYPVVENGGGFTIQSFLTTVVGFQI